MLGQNRSGETWRLTYYTFPLEEAKELLKVGFDYITEKNGIMLFRRPKRFGSLGVINEA